MRDGQASRRRLIEAATAEFAHHGIAGARVDRIARAARVNKAQMYSYYGSKDGLFEAVFAEHLQAIVEAVPFTADDLPGYAARLYTSYVDDPALLRLATWSRLERVPAGDLLASAPHHAEPMHAAIASAQRDGVIVPDLTPPEVYALVTAVAMTWSPVNVTFAAGPADPEAEHERRRAIIAGVVARALLVGGRGQRGA